MWRAGNFICDDQGVLLEKRAWWSKFQAIFQVHEVNACALVHEHWNHKYDVDVPDCGEARRGTVAFWRVRWREETQHQSTVHSPGGLSLKTTICHGETMHY